MKSSIRKLSALFLVIMLLFVVACSSKTADNKSTINENENASTETSSATNTEPAATSDDMGGIKITYVDPWGRDLTPGVNDYNDKLIERIAEVEKRFNVHFEWKKGPETYWDDMTKAVAAGKPYGDIMFTFPWVAPGWIKAGAAKDLSKLGVDFNDGQEWDPIATAEGSYGDKQFLFGNRPVELNGGITYNKALFDKAGIEDPQTLYEKGEWTFEKFEEVAKTLSDSQKGVYGFATTQANSIISILELSNDAPLVDFSKTPMISNFGDPNAIAGYDLVHRMMHIDKSWYKDSEDYAALGKQFLEGKIAMLGAEKWVIDSFRADAPEDFDYRWVVFPKGPNATKNTMTAGVFLEFIPATVDDQKAKYALIVYNAIFKSLYPSVEEEYTAYAESIFTDEKSVEAYVKTYVNKDYSPTFINKAGITDVMNQFDQELKDGKSTPTALVGKYKPLVEAAIKDSVYNQIVK